MAIHDIANGKVQTRSYSLVVVGSFSYDDFTSGTGLAFCDIGVGSIVVGGALFVTTNWNSGTTAGAELGDATTANRYMASENLLAAGDEFGPVVEVAAPGYLTVAATAEILLEVTESGTAATAGAGYAYIEYISTTKADENFEG
jgi:hypothetical protein